MAQDNTTPIEKIDSPSPDEIHQEPSDSALKQCSAERDEYLDGWQRARADYENLLRRMSDEKQQARADALKETFQYLLPVVDHIERALKDIPEQIQVDPWVQGIIHIKRTWDDFLKQSHVERIKTVGEIFDPTIHEALAERENDTVVPGTILEEVEGGYQKGTVILRVAKVIVARLK